MVDLVFCQRINWAKFYKTHTLTHGPRYGEHCSNAHLNKVFSKKGCGNWKMFWSLNICSRVCECHLMLFPSVVMLGILSSFCMVQSVLTSKIAKFHFKVACKVTSFIDMDRAGRGGRRGNLALTFDGNPHWYLQRMVQQVVRKQKTSFVIGWDFFFPMVFGIFHLSV